VKRAVAPLLLGTALALVAFAPGRLLLPGEPFPAGRLLSLAAAHAGLVVLGILPAGLLGLGLGLLVTRPSGRALRPAADALAAAAQAVPPVVVVALAFPALGFGPWPTVLALLLYCLMPVLRGTVAGLEAVPPDARESAVAMGLTPAQVLRQVELPLAFPVILAALRVSAVLAVATAAVGALAGAATLGTPIVLGLQNRNDLLILQGAAATAALAFWVDGALLLAGASRSQG
jgi:osmoprotectant transport system permease protein